MASKKTKVGIVGLGSFGALLAEILEPHTEVLGYSRRGKVEGLPENVRQATLEEVCESDVIILAAELAALKAQCLQIAPLVRKSTLVMDVCSVKIKPAEIMTKYLQGKCQLLATHPLFGPHSVALKGLKGQKMVVHELTESALAPVEDLFVNQLGLNLIAMTPEEHDQEMAWVHSLTFFVGRGLLELDPPKSQLATGYYEQLLNLVDIERTQSFELFKTVELGNPYSKDMREQYLRALQRLHIELEAES